MHSIINTLISLVYRKPNFPLMLHYTISRTQTTFPPGGLTILHDKFLVALVLSFASPLLLTCKKLLNGVVALYMLICTSQTTNFVSLMHMFPLSHLTASKKDLTLIHISRIFFDNPSRPISSVFLWVTLMFALR